MLRFQLISDIHGRFDKVKWDDKADIILCAGDVSENIVEGMKFLKKSPKPIIYIAGNHEFYNGNYQERLELLKEECEKTNGFITFADNETVYVDNVRIIATTLWTNFNNFDPLLVATSENNMNDYFYIKTDGFFDKNIDLVDTYHNILKDYVKDVKSIMKGTNEFNKTFMMTELQKINERHRLGYKSVNDMLKDFPHNENKFNPALSYSLHLKSIDFLKNALLEDFDGKTIVMTHHAPSFTALSMSRFAVDVKAINMKPFLKRFVMNNKIGSYVSAMEQIATQHQDIDAWVHGHLHDRMFYRLGSAAVHCNPTGNQKNEEERTGFDTYSFYINDFNKKLSLINTLEHALFKIERVNDFLLTTIKNQKEKELFEDKDVLKGVFNEVYVIIRTLRSLPSKEIQIPLDTYKNFYDIYNGSEQNVSLSIKHIVEQNNIFKEHLTIWKEMLKKETSI